MSDKRFIRNSMVKFYAPLIISVGIGFIIAGFIELNGVQGELVKLTNWLEVLQNPLL